MYTFDFWGIALSFVNEKDVRMNGKIKKFSQMNSKQSSFASKDK
jgi:hypothetical protein